MAPTPALHLSGVSAIPGITELQVRTGYVGIPSASLYVPEEMPGPAASLPHVLFPNMNGLYDVVVDGSGLHRLPLDMADCLDHVAVSPDSRWVACNTVTSIGVASLNAQPGDSVHILIQGAGAPYTGGVWYRDVAWASDGRHFAVTKIDGANTDERCSLAFYGVTPDHRAAQLQVLVPLPAFQTSFDGGPGCTVAASAWSPDGKELAFLDIAVAQETVYTLPLERVLPLLTGTGGKAGSAAPVVTETPSPVAVMASSGPVWWPAPGMRTLIVIAADLHRLVRVDVTTGQQETLLSVPVERLCGVSPVFQGQLVFTLCAPGGHESFTSLAQLFVYRLPSS